MFETHEIREIVHHRVIAALYIVCRLRFSRPNRVELFGGRGLTATHTTQAWPWLPTGEHHGGLRDTTWGLKQYLTALTYKLTRQETLSSVRCGKMGMHVHVKCLSDKAGVTFGTSHTMVSVTSILSINSFLPYDRSPHPAWVELARCDDLRYSKNDFIVNIEVTGTIVCDCPKARPTFVLRALGVHVHAPFSTSNGRTGFPPCRFVRKSR